MILGNEVKKDKNNFAGLIWVSPEVVLELSTLFAKKGTNSADNQLLAEIN